MSRKIENYVFDKEINYNIIIGKSKNSIARKQKTGF